MKNQSPEIIPEEQFNEAMGRFISDGENPRFFGACFFFLDFAHGGRLSFFWTDDGPDFNYSISYQSPYAAPLEASVKVVGAE